MLPALWFVILGVVIALLAGMVFLVIAEALVPSGSCPGRSTCCGPREGGWAGRVATGRSAGSWRGGGCCRMRGAGPVRAGDAGVPGAGHDGGHAHPASPGFDIVAEARRFAGEQLTAQFSPDVLRKTAADELIALLPGCAASPGASTGSAERSKPDGSAPTSASLAFQRVRAAVCRASLTACCGLPSQGRPCPGRTQRALTGSIFSSEARARS